MNEKSTPPKDGEQASLWAKVKDQFREFWEALRNTPEAFRLVWAADRFTTLENMTLTFVAAVLPATQAWVSKLIIDSIVTAIKQGGDFQVNLKIILPLVALEFFLVVLGSMVGQMRVLFNRILQSQVTNHINKLLINKALTLDLQFFENPLFYDTLQNARRQTDSNALKIVNSSLQMVQQIITLLSLILLLLSFSPWLPLIVFLSAIPVFLAQSQYAEREFRAVSARTADNRLTNYMEALLTGSDAVKEVKLFGLGQMLLERYMAFCVRFHKEDVVMAKKKTFSGLGWGLLSTLTYYGSFIWIIARTIAGTGTLGDMTMFLSIFRQTQNSIQTLLDSLSRLYESNLFMDNLMKFLKLQPLLVAPENGLAAPKPILKGFEFKNVSFRYPDSDVYVLKNINLTIVPGERLALVGLNGAGKTTLIKLLTRLYDPTEGQVLLDGVDLREYDLKSLYKNISVVFQDFIRYQFTVRENIGFGQLEALEDLEQIKHAAGHGGAAPFVEKLPKGYDTLLGKRWEKGQDLSGGQWQKIALSRAFMRDAEVMVLDEPTSALDAQAEFEVFQGFEELMEERISVLITHRFSNVRMVDRIVVLQAGQIIEIGSHSELMALQDGTYKRLFSLQAEGYR